MSESLLQQVVKDLSLGEKVDSLEREMLEHPQVPCPVIHRFGPGTYIREVMIPAGTIAIGHHQNFEHTNIFLKGRVTMLNDDGSIKELVAPMIFVGKPGRKVGYIHEDMVWLNVYATDEKDVDKLEAHFLTKSVGWQESLKLGEQVKRLQGSVDQTDYNEMIKDLGVTEEVVRAQSVNESDMTELPHGGYKIKVAESSIEGKGLFATADIEPGEVIAPARISGKRTIAGRFTNHSATPNAKMVQGFDADINLVATQAIQGCRGGLDGEEITIDYREAFALTKEINLRGTECQR